MQLCEIFVWLAKLLRWGNFRRVAKPLYYRLDHPRSFTSEYSSSPEDRKRAAWTTLFTGLLEAAMPLCRTPEERLFFQQTILDRIVAYPTILSSKQRAQLLRKAHRRMSRAPEIRGEYTPAQAQKNFPQSSKSYNVDWTRLSCSSGPECGELFIKSASGPEWGELIYPRSRMRRVIYQIRHLFEMLRRKMSRLFLTG